MKRVLVEQGPTAVAFDAGHFGQYASGVFTGC